MPRLLQGILALIIIKNVIFFVLLDSNVLVDCIEFLILCRHCNLALSISEKNGRNRSHLARVPGKIFPGYLCDFSHRF